MLYIVFTFCPKNLSTFLVPSPPDRRVFFDALPTLIKKINTLAPVPKLDTANRVFLIFCRIYFIKSQEEEV